MLAEGCQWEQFIVDRHLHHQVFPIKGSQLWRTRLHEIWQNFIASINLKSVLSIGNTFPTKKSMDRRRFPRSTRKPVGWMKNHTLLSSLCSCNQGATLQNYQRKKEESRRWEKFLTNYHYLHYIIPCAWWHITHRAQSNACIFSWMGIPNRMILESVYLS